MHRSRLSTLLIDVPADQAAASADFWSTALGTTRSSPPDEPQYISLEHAIPGLVTAVQVLESGEPRFHVDLETDDVPAEVARLTASGAEEIAEWQGCHTLRAPGGHLLCVIPLHSDPDEFAAAARTWP